MILGPVKNATLAGGITTVVTVNVSVFYGLDAVETRIVLKHSMNADRLVNTHVNCPQRLDFARQPSLSGIMRALRVNAELSLLEDAGAMVIGSTQRLCVKMLASLEYEDSTARRGTVQTVVISATNKTPLAAHCVSVD